MKVSYDSEKNNMDDILILMRTKQEQNAKFTCLRLDHQTIPDGLYAYDIRENCDTGNLCTIEPLVLVNHGGTIITEKPLSFPMRKRNPKDKWLSLSGRYSFM